ncbi:TPA: hypothetical protein ACGD5G_002510 [Serratia marcescens]|nr:hypothetical protein SMKC031_45320 [Serratia marcescens]HBV9082786.1 hypothetical protein [Serratia marcescens]
MLSNRELEIIRNSGSDIEYLIERKNSLTFLDFEMQSFNYFDKYLENKKIIPWLLKTGNFTFELAIIWKMDEERWFTHPLNYFLDNVRHAFKDKKDSVINYLDLYYPIIHEALESYHDAFFLTAVNSKLKKRELVRHYFRMIGDTIESVHYPLLKFIYDMLKLCNVSPSFNKIDLISYGKIVSELSRIECFNYLLNDFLDNIALNHWRNISQHTSYKYSEEEGDVILSYGKNKSVRLKIADLESIMLKLNILQQWLKLAVEFIYIDLLEYTNISNNLKITTESLLSQLGNVLPLRGYSIIGIEKILDNWSIKITDNDNLGVGGFKKSIDLFYPVLKGFHFNKIKLTIELFDKHNKSIQKLFLEER